MSRSISIRSIALPFLIGVSLTVRFAAAQNATCFEDGAVADCSQFISTFCNFASGTSSNPEDSVSRCYTLTMGLKCDFTAWHAVPNTGDSPAAVNCETVLNTVASSCVRGGSGRFAPSGAFVFTMDPNTGACGDTSTIPNTQ